jgi:hypothetical protein
VRDDPSRLWDWRDPPFLAWTKPRGAPGAPPAAR